MKKYWRHITAIIIIVVLAGLAIAYFNKDKLENISMKQRETVNVQLKWLHQSQFAGMYVAKEKGFYAEEGLDVNLLPFDFNTDIEESVLNGEMDFAVTGGSELMRAIEDGKKVRAIAAIYKKTPYTLYTLEKNNIDNPDDFKNKTIGIQPNTDGEILLKVMLKSLGISEDDLDIVETGYDANDLINGDIDISSGYIINEPQQAINAGFSVNTFLMADYGANLYGDTLIASQDLIDNDPELVQRFVRATLEGWQYAIENPKEAVDIVLKYTTDRTKEHERYMILQSIPLIDTGKSPIGLMQAEEWQRNIDLLLNQGIIQNAIEPDTIFTNQFIQDNQ